VATRSRAFWLTQRRVVWNVEADRNELFSGTSRTPAPRSLEATPSPKPPRASLRYVLRPGQRDSTDRDYLIYFVLSRHSHCYVGSGASYAADQGNGGLSPADHSVVGPR
jgi:hypothetical protein